MNENTERVKAYLTQFGRDGEVVEFAQGATATVPLAAQAIGCEEAQIAKTMSFMGPDGCAILVVTAGDGKVNSGKYKRALGAKATMLKGEEVKNLTSHPIGGVCPFALPACVGVYLDISLQRFDHIYPACGSPESMIKLTPDELFTLSGASAWVDVCKGWQEDEA